MAPVTGPEASVGFKLAQVYLISATLGYRFNPLFLPADTKITPQAVNVSIGLETSSDGISSHVRVGVATNREDGDRNAIYDFAVEIGAIVTEVDRVKFPDALLLEHVAAMIFPFLRETVANLTMRGRFGIVWLNPFDVRSAILSLTQQQQQQQAQALADLIARQQV